MLYAGMHISGISMKWHPGVAMTGMIVAAAHHHDGWQAWRASIWRA